MIWSSLTKSQMHGSHHVALQKGSLIPHLSHFTPKGSSNVVSFPNLFSFLAFIASGLISSKRSKNPLTPLIHEFITGEPEVRKGFKNVLGDDYYPQNPQRYRNPLKTAPKLKVYLWGEKTKSRSGLAPRLSTGFNGPVPNSLDSRVCEELSQNFFSCFVPSHTIGFLERDEKESKQKKKLNLRPATLNPFIRLNSGRREANGYGVIQSI